LIDASKTALPSLKKDIDWFLALKDPEFGSTEIVPDPNKRLDTGIYGAIFHIEDCNCKKPKLQIICGS
jgi:hypothetical protein